MECSHCHDLVVEALYGELDETKRTAFEAHLSECESCAAEYRALQGVVAALPKDKEFELLDVQRNAVLAEADRVAALVVPVAPAEIMPLSARRETRSNAWMGYAAAALLCVGLGGLLVRQLNAPVEQSAFTESAAYDAAAEPMAVMMNSAPEARVMAIPEDVPMQAFAVEEVEVQLDALAESEIPEMAPAPVVAMAPSMADSAEGATRSSSHRSRSGAGNARQIEAATPAPEEAIARVAVSNTLAREEMVMAEASGAARPSLSAARARTTADSAQESAVLSVPASAPSAPTGGLRPPTIEEHLDIAERLERANVNPSQRIAEYESAIHTYYEKLRVHPEGINPAVVPRIEYAQFRVAQVYLEAGNRDKARAGFEKYLERYPTGRYASNAREILNGELAR